MNLNQWFNKGLTVDQYIAGMNVNQAEMKKIMEKFTLSEHEKDSLSSLKGKDLKVIVLSEDWCGDALLNNPILLKIAQEIGMEVRFLLRDQNLELMDQYLTNGTSRAIPIFIFINQDGEQQAVWGPRAQQIQAMVEEGLKGLPAKDDPEFKEKQMEMYGKLKKSYQEDKTLWHIVADSVINVLISKQ